MSYKEYHEIVHVFQNCRIKWHWNENHFPASLGARASRCRWSTLNSTWWCPGILGVLENQPITKAYNFTQSVEGYIPSLLLSRDSNDSNVHGWSIAVRGADRATDFLLNWIRVELKSRKTDNRAWEQHAAQRLIWSSTFCFLSLLCTIFAPWQIIIVQHFCNGL